jgi:RimJ/RimL family protein N-acetyltransferase
VLEKIGFRREAHMIEAFFARGQWQSEYMYAMLAREWAPE